MARFAWIVLVLPLPLGAQQGWIADPALQRRLAAHEVVVQADAAVDRARPHGSVRAAVLIKAPPERIWAVVTDCRQTLSIVPGLRSCRSVGRADDGSWEDIEQEVRYSWLLPSVRYVFRADYQRPHRISFRRISGDLKAEEGTWELQPTPDHAGTLVVYEMYLDPGFWIPQTLVTRSLRRDVPAALSALRQRVENPGTKLARDDAAPVP